VKLFIEVENLAMKKDRFC